MQEDPQYESFIHTFIHQQTLMEGLQCAKHNARNEIRPQIRGLGKMQKCDTLTSI